MKRMWRWKRYFSFILSLIIVLNSLLPAVEVKADNNNIGEPVMTESINADDSEEWKLAGAIVDIDTQWTQDRYYEVVGLIDNQEDWPNKLTAWKNDKALSEIALVSGDEELTNVTVSLNDMVLIKEDGRRIKADNIDFTATFVKSTKAYNGEESCDNPLGGYLDVQNNLKYPEEERGHFVFHWNDSHGYNRSESSDILYQTTPWENMPQNSVQPLWIEFSIPEEATAGLYESRIQITANEIQEPLTFTYQVKVFDATLPVATDFKNSFDIEINQFPYRSAEYYGYKPFNEDHLDFLRSSMNLYKSIGGDAITATIVDNVWGNIPYGEREYQNKSGEKKTYKIYYPSMVKWYKTPKNKSYEFTWNFDELDTWINFCRDTIGIGDKIVLYGLTPYEKKLGYWEKNDNEICNHEIEDGEICYCQYTTYCTDTIDLTTAEDYKNWKDFITALRNHLIDKGWFEYTYLGIETEYHTEDFDSMLRLVNAVSNERNGKYKGVTFKIAGILTTHDSNQFGWDNFTDQVSELSFLATNVGKGIGNGYVAALFDNVYNVRKETGKINYIYNQTLSKPGNFSLSAPVESYWSVLLAGYMEASGFHYRAYDSWVKNPLEDTSHYVYEAGESFLIYPGELLNDDTTPVAKSSIRLERMAQGIRDVNKLLLLKKEGVDVDDAYNISNLVQILCKNGRYPFIDKSANGSGEYISDEALRSLCLQTTSFTQELNALTEEYVKLKEDKSDKVISLEIQEGDSLELTLGEGLSRSVSEKENLEEPMNMTSGMVQLTAIFNPTNFSNKNVIWESSNEKIVSVDKEGRIVAKAVGTAIITATAEVDSEKKDQITITVVPAEIENVTWRAYYSFDNIGENERQVPNEWDKDKTEHSGKLIESAAIAKGYRGNALSVTQPLDGMIVDENSLLGDWTIGYWVKTDADLKQEVSVLEDSNKENSLALNMVNTEGDSDGYGLRMGEKNLTFGKDDRFENSEWQHLTWVKVENVGLYLYINGEIAFRGAAEFDVQTKGKKINAPYQIVGGEGFTGLIDELKVYDKALTPAEVIASMQQISYPVTFNKNSEKATGSMQPQDFYAEKENLNLIENEFEWPGYIFKGWNTKPNEIKIVYEDKDTVSKNDIKRSGKLDLYAQWQTSKPDTELKETTVESGTELKLTCVSEGANIYYTTDGTEPTHNSKRYDEAIILTENVTIKAIAITEGCMASDVLTLNYEVFERDVTSAPKASVNSGEIVTKGTKLELYCDAEGAKIYYTTDGSDPTVGSKLYEGPINLEEDITIKAIAIKDGFRASNVVTWDYLVIPKGYHIVYFYKNSEEAVGEMKPHREKTRTTTLLRENKFEREDHIFTGWNTDPNGNGDKYDNRNGIILIDFKDQLSINLYAQWKKIDTVVTPYADLYSNSVVEAGTKLKLSCEEEGAKIYYTIDGTQPTIESTPYADAITITENMDIKAIAVKEGYENSDVLELSYKVVERDVAYIISFNTNAEGVEGEMPQQSLMKNGLTMLTKNTFEKEGYVFSGWNTNADGSGTYYRDKAVLLGFDISAQSPINLYAQWTPMEQLAEPVASVETGEIVRKGTEVVLEHEETGVRFFYTVVQDTDSHVMPTKKSNRYADSFIIDRDMDIIVTAMKEDYIASEPVMFSYRVAETGEIYFEDVPEGGLEAVDKGLWVAGIDDAGYTYTGKAIKPEIRVYDYTTLLKEKKDYTISYRNNVKVNDASNTKKAPTITVKAKGNYKGKDTKVFKINPKDMSVSENNIYAYDITLPYNSKKVQKPAPVVYDNGKKLKKNRDYKIEYVGLETGEKNFKDAGDYKIKITGLGNYSGDMEINFTITNDIPMSKVSVGKIKKQDYNRGNPITPPIVIKNKGIELTPNVHYEVKYENNIEVGNATAIISAIKGSGFMGEKRVTFKIGNVPLKKAKFVATLAKSVAYTGKEITYEEVISNPQNIFSKDGVALVSGNDFEITYQKNTNKGKATILFTGKGGYTGKVKKTFKILPYELTGEKIKVVVEPVVDYTKGGAKADVTVLFGNRVLKEKVDYTLKYKNNNVVEDDNVFESKVPEVIITGKGNFKGKVTKQYSIVRPEPEVLKMELKDKVYKKKANAYKSVPKIIDTANNKALKVKTDYEKTILYTYKTDTELEDGTKRKAGEEVGKKDIVPAGYEIHVTVTTKGKYKGIVEGDYRITTQDISKAKVKTSKLDYTGNKIELDEKSISVKFKRDELTFGEDYEIVENSYQNNVKKGTAKVTIKGKGNYGGTKVISFKIQSKTFSWWEKLKELILN